MLACMYGNCCTADEIREKYAAAPRLRSFAVMEWVLNYSANLACMYRFSATEVVERRRAVCTNHMVCQHFTLNYIAA